VCIFRGALVGILILAQSGSLATNKLCAGPSCDIETYIEPYSQTHNFSGVVLAARAGVPVFAKAYGFADRERRIPNSLNTRFHIASMSMQFTAAAALRLIDERKLSLDTPVSDVVPDFPNDKDITVQNLLAETSGIADINAQSDYADVLKKHQTPRSLVNHMRNLPPLRKPGTFEREEHSAYNMLALIIEKKTGVPFAEAVRKLVFRPLGMNDSGIDDDSPAAARNAAKGYQPIGLYDIQAASPIHWSAKAGNASAYSTASDELRFVRGVLGDKFLSPRLRNLMFDIATPVGYGWFKSRSKRFGQPVYTMNGRSPGFSSAVAFLTKDQLFVVALSNLYDSAPSDISLDIAAILSGRPYQRLTLKTVVDSRTLAGMPASFQFQEDFYQPNALLHLHATNGQVFLDWPSGIQSALIPTSKDHFIDRNFWVPVEIIRGGGESILQLKYDRFIAPRVNHDTGRAVP
jgi:CubicO group peptidase (beta-lactamase class C family)